MGTLNIPCWTHTTPSPKLPLQQGGAAPVRGGRGGGSALGWSQPNSISEPGKKQEGPRLGVVEQFLRSLQRLW